MHAHWQIITTPFVPSSVDVARCIKIIKGQVKPFWKLSSSHLGFNGLTKKKPKSSPRGAAHSGRTAAAALRSMCWLPSAGLGTHGRNLTEPCQTRSWNHQRYRYMSHKCSKYLILFLTDHGYQIIHFNTFHIISLLISMWLLLLTFKTARRAIWLRSVWCWRPSISWCRHLSRVVSAGVCTWPPRDIHQLPGQMPF